MHQGDVLTIDDGVDGEVALDAVFITLAGNVLQVVDGECRGRACTHIELLDAEIDGVGTSLYRCRQRLLATHRCHHLEIL